MFTVTRVRKESTRQKDPEEGFLYLILKQSCKKEGLIKTPNRSE
jgi:hypothetical protein